MPAAAATSAMLACSPRPASTSAAASRIAVLTRVCSVVCRLDISVSFRVSHGLERVPRSQPMEAVSCHETNAGGARMLKHQLDDASADGGAGRTLAAEGCLGADMRPESPGGWMY